MTIVIQNITVFTILFQESLGFAIILWSLAIVTASVVRMARRNWLAMFNRRSIPTTVVDSPLVVAATQTANQVSKGKSFHLKRWRGCLAPIQEETPLELTIWVLQEKELAEANGRLSVEQIERKDWSWVKHFYGEEPLLSTNAQGSPFLITPTQGLPTPTSIEQEGSQQQADFETEAAEGGFPSPDHHHEAEQEQVDDLEVVLLDMVEPVDQEAAPTAVERVQEDEALVVWEEVEEGATLPLPPPPPVVEEVPELPRRSGRARPPICYSGMCESRRLRCSRSRQKPRR